MEIYVAEDFLELVWGDKEGYVDMPAKVGRYWTPYSFHWPNDGACTRRIDTSMRDDEDLYYSPGMFKSKGRRIEDALPTVWLWADLDEVHPSAGARLGLLPTVGIQSSPGRYQALWRLDEEIRGAKHEELCRALTYALDADKGGWDTTQVLRIPLTRNFKYEGAPFVEALWIHEDVSYGVDDVWEAVKDWIPERGAEASGIVPKKPISSRAKQLLRSTVDQVVTGERSARLWELECLLAEAGLEEGEIVGLVRDTPWNKWRGKGEAGRRRLGDDVRKALSHVRRKGENAKKFAAEKETAPAAMHETIPWVGYSTFLNMRVQETLWLVENLWTSGSHGIIGGEPKTLKTTVALALGLSVASGKPFLGKYRVDDPGPVLFVQEENPLWMMQDRLMKLSILYGLIDPAGMSETADAVDVPIRLLNNFGFSLGLEEHRNMLEAEVEAFKPKLVVLDPLYLMMPADTDRASELQQFLRWLLRLRYEYNTAVIIVHHMGKAKVGKNVPQGIRPGQRLLGSTTLHGWTDAALYLSYVPETRDGWTSVMMEREFRSTEPKGPIALALNFGDPGDTKMKAELNVWALEAEIMSIVSREPGITTAKLGEMLGVDKRKIRDCVTGGELGMQVETRRTGYGLSYRIFSNGSN